MAEPSVEEYQAYTQPLVVKAGLDWPTIKRQVNQESGWRQFDAAGNILTSSGGAKGISQLNGKFYGPDLWGDALTGLRTLVSLMSMYLQKYGSYRKALAAYNWGPGNVAGYTDAQGVVHPAWDGRRETISVQGAHYLDSILGPDWAEPGAAPVAGAAISYDAYPDGDPAGTFSGTPRGLILHGSRSGVAGNPKATEYAGTARYEQTNHQVDASGSPYKLGWNATIGEHQVAVHLDPHQWGWNARGSSSHWLAVELAQATVDEAVSDAQVDALADYILTHLLVAWPGLPMQFPSHAELDGTPEYGFHDGKTDVFPKADPRMDQLRVRLMARLKGGTVTSPSYSVGPGILDRMAAAGDAPASDELQFKKGETDEWSEAIGQSGARYAYVTSLNKTFRYPSEE